MFYYKFKNNYEVEKYDSNKKMITSYDYDATDEIRIKYRVKIAPKKSDYITRGHQVLDEKNHRMWDNFVNSTVHGDNTWEGASVVEASLAAMEMLSNENRVEKAFSTVDVYSDTCVIYNDLALSEASSIKASEIVILLHNRGEEFRKYRNQVIKEKNKEKVK